MGHFSGYFEGASTFLTPQKLISRIFKISGTLIVNLSLLIAHIYKSLIFYTQVQYYIWSRFISIKSVSTLKKTLILYLSTEFSLKVKTRVLYILHLGSCFICTKSGIILCPLQRHCTENWKQIFPEMKLLQPRSQPSFMNL